MKWREGGIDTLTDERLAEIEYLSNNISIDTLSKELISDLITALRVERAKVVALECRECSVETAGCKYVDGVVEGMETELAAERAKVTELESTNQWMHGLIKTYQSEKAELQKEINILNDTIDNMVEQSD
jgi:alpha-L-fucosidase